MGSCESSRRGTNLLGIVPIDLRVISGVRGVRKDIDKISLQ